MRRCFRIFRYKGKPILPTRKAQDEMYYVGIDLYKVIEILKSGVKLAKRKKGIEEKGITKGNKIIKVVVVDMGDYYKFIHVGKFNLSKKFKKFFKA